MIKLGTVDCPECGESHPVYYVCPELEIREGIEDLWAVEDIGLGEVCPGCWTRKCVCGEGI